MPSILRRPHRFGLTILFASVLAACGVPDTSPAVPHTGSASGRPTAAATLATATAPAETALPVVSQPLYATTAPSDPHSDTPIPATEQPVQSAGDVAPAAAAAYDWRAGVTDQLRAVAVARGGDTLPRSPLYPRADDEQTATDAAQAFGTDWFTWPAPDLRFVDAVMRDMTLVTAAGGWTPNQADPVREIPYWEALLRAHAVWFGLAPEHDLALSTGDPAARYVLPQLIDGQPLYALAGRTVITPTHITIGLAAPGEMWAGTIVVNGHWWPDVAVPPATLQADEVRDALVGVTVAVPTPAAVAACVGEYPDPWSTGQCRLSQFCSPHLTAPDGSGLAGCHTIEAYTVQAADVTVDEQQVVLPHRTADGRCCVGWAAIRVYVATIHVPGTAISLETRWNAVTGDLIQRDPHEGITAVWR